ncbi:MAG: DNA gyrase subunit A [Spirochaetes bacterium]|nr:DNA gyrase subunit A [Spirochaetota bacterium]
MDMGKNENIIIKKIQNEIEQSYITYSLSVIIGRAIPDIRDGLKPVHRRILWSMWEQGITFESSTKKCARIVGDVLGKYHPHGDAAVYDALVRLAQDFSLRYPLIIGQGNFGSIDGDVPAAMRYTEAKLAKISNLLLEDIDKETVNFLPNFDDSLNEPEVLPSNIPNLFINGAEGIGVGMSTSIPPHNLSETIDALIYLIKNPNSTIEELIKFVKGPDFPTYGTLILTDDFYQTYYTGKGRFIIRGKVKIEEEKGQTYIVITELPFQVNKADLIKKIVDLVKSEVIDGITDLRDESDQEGIRIVIKVKKGEKPSLIINKLYKHTNLQKTYNANMVAIYENKPITFNLKDYLVLYYNFKKEIMIKRFNFILRKAKDRLHILEGLIVALNNIDEVINIIKKSKDAQFAKQKLMEKFDLSNVQAQAILDMRLQRLTTLEVEKIKIEYSEVKTEIERIEKILSSEENINLQIIKELEEVKTLFGDKRRTDLITLTEEEDLKFEIIPEEVIIIFTNIGFIKRLKANSFYLQNKGGKGKKGINLNDEDEIKFIQKAVTTDYICFFTNKGKLYTIKVNDISEGSMSSKGEHISNFIDLDSDEEVKNIEVIKEFNKDESILIITKKGITKRVQLNEISGSLRRNGVKYAKILEGDEIVDSIVCKNTDEVLISTKKGKSIRFKVDDVRETGRESIGVKGVTLEGNDYVVSIIKVEENKKVLILTSNGFAKRVQFEEFPLQKRGGKGVSILSNIEKAGEIVKIISVDDNSEIIIATTDGKTIKIKVNDINIQKRNTMGSRIVKTNDGEKVSDITVT